jgi:predicted RNA-binding Zn-ribbon protein involved in translation (DUF1610 family)
VQSSAISVELFQHHVQRWAETSITNTRIIIHRYKIWRSLWRWAGALHRVSTNKKIDLQQTLAIHRGYIFFKCPMNGETMMLKLRPCGKIWVSGIDNT